MARLNRTPWQTDRRAGFTLTELLVVIGITLILFAMIASISLRTSDKQRVPQGAASLQGWLKVAQQMALRDQAPRGLRLMVPSGSQLVTELQYIEQPDDYVLAPGTQVSCADAGSGQTSVTLTHAATNPDDFSGGQSSASNYPVQAGDYIEFYTPTPNLVFVISSVNGPTSLTIWANYSTYATQLPTTANPTTCFRIVRQPRMKVGEATLSMPSNTVIDISTNSTYGSPLPTAVNNNIDLLFSPAGSLMGAGLPGNDLKFWIRDTSAPPATGQLFNGEQLLVTVASRTGLVGIQPVNLSNNGSQYTTPYSNTQSGRSNGF